MSEQAKAAHSRFGGSVIGRVIGCPGSVPMNAAAPPKIETQHMVEGTLAHDFAEYMLKHGERDAMRHVGEDYPFASPAKKKLQANCGRKYLTVSKDMARAVQTYIDAVYEALDEDPLAELYVEQSFTLPAGDGKEVFGKNDALVYQPTFRRVKCFDYKHGAGEVVDVEENEQPMFYCVGALLNNPWPVAEIELIIVQPRTWDVVVTEHEGVKRWAWDTGELLEFLAQVDAAVAAAKTAELMPRAALFDNGFITPGEHCGWCAASAVCPAREKDLLEMTGLPLTTLADASPANLPDPATLDGAHIARIMAAAGALRAWAGQCAEYAFNAASAGTPIPGFKLVDKNARRKWVSSDAAVADFLEMMGCDRAEVLPPSLVTITEAEKQLRAAVGSAKDFKAAKERLSLDFTIKESSGLTLAPESDKREAVDAVARAFGSVTITPPPA